MNRTEHHIIIFFIDKFVPRLFHHPSLSHCLTLSLSHASLTLPHSLSHTASLSLSLTASLSLKRLSASLAGFASRRRPHASVPLSLALLLAVVVPVPAVSRCRRTRCSLFHAVAVPALRCCSPQRLKFPFIFLSLYGFYELCV